MTFTVTPGTTYSATSPVTSTNLNAHVSGLTISGITNTQIDTTATSLVQIISGDAGATTTEGAALWNKTTDKYGVNDGTTWVNHVQGEAMATLPRLLTNYEWFDTTLGIKRIYITRNGLLGFHPLENGYLLVNNGSGAALAAGDVVVTDYATGVNHVKKTTTIKDQTVIGVCLEAIADAASGVIATYGCPKNVTVNIDETDGALAVGDGIVSYSATNRGRTIGPLPTSGYVTASTRATGVPLGCFAVALTTVTANQATARMLPQIGTGARRGTSIISLTPATTSGVSVESNFTSSLVSAKHAPAYAVDLVLLITGDAGAAGDEFDLDISLLAQSGGGAVVAFGVRAQSGAAGNYEVVASSPMPTVNDTTTPTALGQKFLTQFTDNAGDVSTSVLPRMVAYYY